MTKSSDRDATRILAADHREVERLFAAYEKARDSAKKQALAEQICTELKIHAQIEEEIFYPALNGKIDEDLLKEAYVEHDGAKRLINEILAGGPDEDFYDAKVMVLKEQIAHHVEEEEKLRGNMFQQARAADVDLETVGDRLLARKEELRQLAATEGLPPAQPATA